MVTRTDLLKAANAAEMAANARTDEEEMRAVMEVMQNREAIQVGLMNAQLQRVAETHRAQNCLPLVDEDGYEFARVRAKIPRDLFFHLRAQGNFGEDGLYSEEGLQDVFKAYPQTKVNTVSGKTTVGWRAPSRRVRFGPGTIQFAQ